MIVAHPDDEALWFGSIVGRVNRTIICFSDVASVPACTEGRRRALPQLPIRNVQSLGLQEAEVFGAANWSRPEIAQDGLVVSRRSGVMPGYSARRYARNFARLRVHLRGALAGTKIVFSHNPWGEYGHEEHVQVFRAVESLRVELGFRLFFTTYVSAKSLALFARYLPALQGPGFAMAINAALPRQLMSIYQAEGCWTWFDDYKWPDTDHFLEWQENGDRIHEGVIVPCRMITLDWQTPGMGLAMEGRGLRRWLSRVKAAGRVLLG